MKMDELLDEIYKEEADFLQLEHEEQDMKDSLLRQENMVLQKIRQEQSRETEFEIKERNPSEDTELEIIERNQKAKTNLQNSDKMSNNNAELSEKKQENYTKEKVINFSEKNRNPKTSKKRKRIKWKKLILLLAAAVMMFGTVVSASRYYDLDIRLEKMIGSSNVMKDLSGGFVEVGVSDTSDNITITATQAIGDKNAQWIVLDTDIPWEVGEEGYYTMEHANFNFYKKHDISESGGYYVESYNNHGRVSFLISAEVEGINRLSVCLDCSTILAFESVEDDWEEGRVVSNGSWKLEWKNKYTGNANTTYPMKTAEFTDGNGNTFTGLIYKIEYSPLIIRAEILKNPMKKANMQLETVEITSVTLKDGTVLPAQMSQGGSSNNTFLHTSISYESMGKMNLEEVEAITLGGVEIELD